MHSTSSLAVPLVAVLGLGFSGALGPRGLTAQLQPGNGSNFGSVTLARGFTPDPHRVALVSGGRTDVGKLGLGERCVGYATTRPDYTVDFDGPADRLRFYVEGEGDTGLIIAAPGRRFHCDDDSRGLNPMVTFDGPSAGRYDVWVSSYSSDENLTSTLYVTTLGYEPGTGGEGRLAVGGSSSNFGRTSLSAGFMPDPHDVPVTSGGSLSVASLGLGPECVGYATRTPDYIVDYAAGSGILRFFVEGEGDTALIVNAPDGSWHCADDSFGTVDPTVTFESPRGGQYDIWVASYAEGTHVAGRLKITELDTERPHN